MLNLQKYQNKLSLDGLLADTADNLIFFKRDSVFVRQPFEHIQVYTGDSNVVMGVDSASSLRNGHNNLMLGHSAGYNTNNVSLTNSKYSSKNVFLGAKAGYGNVDGYLNTFIGFLNRILCC